MTDTDTSEDGGFQVDPIVRDMLDQVAEDVGRRCIDAKSSQDARSKPLAAFRLGFEPYAIRALHHLLWELGPTDFEEDITATVEALRRAILNLAGEIDSAVVDARLREKLESVATASDQMRQITTEKREACKSLLGCDPPPFEADWKDLCHLAKQALSSENEFAPWLSLGAAIGQHALAAQTGESSEDVSALSHLTRIIVDMPPQYHQAVPMLGQIAELHDRLLGESQIECMKQVGELLKTPLIEVSEFEHLDMWKVLEDLADHIKTALETRKLAQASDASFLGLKFGDRKVSRAQYSELADFSKSSRAWQLVCLLFDAGTEGKCRNDLFETIWHDRNKVKPVSPNNLDKQKSVADAALACLEVEIRPDHRGIWRLVELRAE